jgi:excisionase family DNA binding protein
MRATVENINKGSLPRKLTYRPDEVAAALNISLSSIYRRIHDGTLVANKVGGVWRVLGRSLWAHLEIVDDLGSDDEVD